MATVADLVTFDASRCSDLVQIMDPGDGRPRTCTCRSAAISSVWCLYLKAAATASTLELSVCVYLISQFRGNKRRKLAYLGGGGGQKWKENTTRALGETSIDWRIFSFSKGSEATGSTIGIPMEKKEAQMPKDHRISMFHWERRKWQRLIRVNKIYMWKLNKTIDFPL